MYVGIVLVEYVLEATWHLNALKLAFFEVKFALKYPYAIQPTIPAFPIIFCIAAY